MCARRGVPIAGGLAKAGGEQKLVVGTCMHLRPVKAEGQGRYGRTDGSTGGIHVQGVQARLRRVEEPNGDSG